MARFDGPCDGSLRAHAVFAALGAPREAEATSFALSVIGAKSWDELR